MSLKKEFNNLKFDVRMQDINIGSNMITPEDVKAHLSTLVDCADNAMPISIDEPEVVEVEPEDIAQVEQTTMGNVTSNFFGSSDGN